MRWFLVLILMAPGIDNVEHYVAIEMPNEATCEAVREYFVYSTLIQVNYLGEDDRTPWDVDEKECVSDEEI